MTRDKSKNTETQPEKMDLRSHHISEDKQAELLRLFPEVRTEGGKIDFDRLKLTLGETIEVGKERYGMNWPGKAECFKTIQTPSLSTLRPYPEESINFDTTENLIIEGDNLEVLKLLQKAYLGKVKMIYIDPPYNTGNDFIYPDNYAESLQTYLQYTKQIDAEGRKFGTNTEADGRFHSKWINMMLPRLYLARNLLSEDGLIFISIDDHELENLSRLCSDVFGEENKIACLPTIMNLKGNPDAFGFTDTHEYTLVYARNKTNATIGKFDVDEESIEEWEEDDWGLYKRADTLRRTGQDASRARRPKGWFPIFINENGGIYVTDNDCPLTPTDFVIWPTNENSEELSWTWSKKKILSEPHNLVIVEGRTGKNIYKKQRPGIGDLPTKKPKSVLYSPEYSTSSATLQLKKILGAKVFEGPKPVPLLMDLISIGSDTNSIILDFFAGSGTTAQSVIELNRKAGNRKFILVQLPEPLDPNDKDKKMAADFCDSIGKPRIITEITKERVRRVIKLMNNNSATQLNLGSEKNINLGFRVFKLSESNFKPWNAEESKDATELTKQLELQVNHILPGRSTTDILYEVLLKSGFPLPTPIEKLVINGKPVFSVANAALLVCLEQNLSLDIIRAMAERKPERVVFLDEGFAGNDQLKSNAVQTFKIKGVASFKTI